MKIILLHPDIPGTLKFQEILTAQNIGFQVALSLDNVRLECVEVAIIWLSAPEYLQNLPNLKLVFVCGSGVDHLIHATALPRHVSLVRLVDPFLQEHFSDYVIRAIQDSINLSEGCSKTILESNFDDGCIATKKPVVGLMGLGMVGAATAKKLLSKGFNVCGWVRTSRHRDIPDVYVGEAELGEFAIKSEILVCQLPLTNETKGILNHHLFSQLPRGSFLINVARGAHLNEADLLSALESNRLSGACLDVFDVEPLPADHIFRTHPKITVTPHIAGILVPEQQATYCAGIIARHYRGEVPAGVVNYNACY